MSVAFERRLHVRQSANASVRITRLPGHPARHAVSARLVNLSVGGCAVALTDPGSLRVGIMVRLAIIVNVNAVAKVYHRWATVRHITKGIIGFSTDVWTAESERELKSWMKR
jgi:c-di-GMP-binding flagellar brake protein YcgR